MPRALNLFQWDMKYEQKRNVSVLIQSNMRHIYLCINLLTGGSPYYHHIIFYFSVP